MYVFTLYIPMYIIILVYIYLNVFSLVRLFTVLHSNSTAMLCIGLSVDVWLAGVCVCVFAVFCRRRIVYIVFVLEMNCLNWFSR